jgi:hypothetical protein
VAAVARKPYFHKSIVGSIDIMMVEWGKVFLDGLEGRTVCVLKKQKPGPKRNN